MNFTVLITQLLLLYKTDVSISLPISLTSQIILKKILTSYHLISKYSTSEG